MRARPEPPAKPPIWHRSRMGWVNALGFALTFFLALWLLMAVFANLLPSADPIEFPIPTAFVVVLLLAHVATVALCLTLVIGFMLRGADLNEHKPRMYTFFWTCAGLLFFLVQVVILARFGRVQLPNASGFASEVYWGVAPVGLLAFALMAYVNVELPGADHHDEHDDHEHDDHEHDDHEHDDHEYAEHEYGDEEEWDEAELDEAHPTEG